MIALLNRVHLTIRLDSSDMFNGNIHSLCYCLCVTIAIPVLQIPVFEGFMKYYSNNYSFIAILMIEYQSI